MNSSKLNSALESLKKSGIAVYKTGDLPECEVIPTGSLICNKIMGGGVCTRRLTQIFSKPGVGKSVLAYTIINNALKMFPDSISILLDIECRFDLTWASKFIESSVIDRLFVLREEFIENAGNSINKIINQLENIHLSCVVVDSIAAANTARYKDADMSTMEIGGNAMGVGKFARSMVQIAEKNNTAVVILNQLRDDIGAYGPSIGHTPGGSALKHAIDADYYLRALSQKDTKELASGSIEMQSELDETEQIAIGVGIKCMKGKNWSKFAKTVFYRKDTDENNAGYDTFNEVIRLAVSGGIIKRAGERSYTFIHELFPEDPVSGEHKLVGKKNIFQFLKNDHEAYEQIKNQVESSNVIDRSIETTNMVENY